MEEVLDVYQRPPDPRYPLVCLDESHKEQRQQVRLPVAAAPGAPAREDHEYARNGLSNLFMVCAPQQNWRQVAVTAGRDGAQFAAVVRELVDVHFPAAERIVLVLDNLNTHTKASLYAHLPAAEAHRLAGKLEWHYTPKHGSWLNMAEIELSVLGRQCLAQRIPDRATVSAEVAAWVAARNAAQATIRWQFTTADARVKLAHLYPILDLVSAK